MFIHHLIRWVCIVIIALTLSSCAVAGQVDPATQVPEPAAAGSNTQVPALMTTEQPTVAALETETIPVDDLVHLWAESGILNPFEISGIAIGAPDSSPGCGSGLLADLEEPDGEIYLTLQYARPLIPQMVRLVLDEHPEGIVRVEILNTSTGLGREVFNANDGKKVDTHENDECAVSVNLPVEVDFEINTVIIGFDNLAAAAMLDAVELAGKPVLVDEPIVYWRVPLAGIPLSLTVDAFNQVYVSTRSNILFKYDVEGNLLEEQQAPTSGRISDMTTDGAGNLVLSDGDFGEFIILKQDGELERGGGDAPAVQVALGPGQENIYLLGELGMYYLLSYLPGTNEIINPLPLDGTSYVGLSFNPENKLYTIREEDGFLVQIDHITGLEIDSIPIKEFDEAGVSPRDLAIDQDGNFTVLFSSNADNTAVHVLDPNGFQLMSYGELVYQPDGDWPEGSFNDPRAIALSPDGRFAFIIDGNAEFNYLTCLMLRFD